MPPTATQLHHADAMSSFDTSPYIDRLVTTPFRPDVDDPTPPDGPGLGIELDQAAGGIQSLIATMELTDCPMTAPATRNKVFVLVDEIR